jgi:hypothetical protein
MDRECDQPSFAPMWTAAVRELVRFVLLYDDRCLTAEAGPGKCAVAVAPCAAAGGLNASLQQWRLETHDDGTVAVISPAKARELGDPRCVDDADDCHAWASSGECTSNPTYMQKACRRACGVCRPRAPCTTWSWRAPPPRLPSHEDPVLDLGRAAPMLSLVRHTANRSRVHVQLSRWSGMFPPICMLRAPCPGGADGLAAGGGCCLAAGAWALGRRSALVRRALWHACSFHEAHSQSNARRMMPAAHT